MTDQPTTWTPELEDALKRVIKSVDTIQLSYFTQQLRGKVGAALESAAAEIERQKARLRDTNQILVECIGAAGPDSAEDAARRVVAEVERLRAELAAKQPAEAEAAQQGPSDEEIREQFCRVDWARSMTAEPTALVHLVKLVEMVARRAGVKL